MTLRPPLCLLAALLVAASLLPGNARAAASPVLGFSAPVRLSDPSPELAPDSGHQNLAELTAAGGLAFFTAYLPATGTELWVSDGTPLQGTRLVKDIVPGRDSSYPHQLAALGDKLLFVANQKLWVSDGTPGGTRQLGDLEPMYYWGIVVIGDRTFITTAPSGSIDGGRLWISDGTEAGTRLVTNVSVGAPVTALGDKLAFVSRTGDQAALWVSDGTEAGTRQAAPIPAGAGLFTLFHDDIFFVANGGDSLPTLWRSDGTPSGTAPLIPIGSGQLHLLEHLLTSCDRIPPQLIVWRDRLYFTANDGAHGSELWSSDGTAAGTRQVADISDDYFGSHPLRLVGLPDALLFVAKDAPLGYELWRSDGSEQGTQLVRDINPDAESSQVWIRGSNLGSVLCPTFGKLTSFAQLGDRLLLTAGDREHGYELWASDGSAAGTQLVSDLVPGAGSSTPDSFVRVGGQIMFRAADARGNVSLWAIRAQPYQQLVSLVRR